MSWFRAKKALPKEKSSLTAEQLDEQRAKRESALLERPKSMEMTPEEEIRLIDKQWKDFHEYPQMAWDATQQAYKQAMQRKAELEKQIKPEQEHREKRYARRFSESDIQL